VTKTILAVVAPVFNEEAVIEKFHARTSVVLESIENVDFRIVYVVDRCTDNTLEILRNIARSDPKTTVIALSSRFGHQMSLLAGIEHALDSDAIVMMDSDLQHPPELIPELLRHYFDGADVVFTVRTDTEDVGFIRKAIGNYFYRVLNWLSDVTINPSSADFRLISQRVSLALAQGFMERKLFLRGLFSWIGFKQVGVAYVAEKRLAVSGVLSFSTKPLQIGIFAGGLLAVVALVLTVFTIVNYFVDKSLPSGWTTVVTLLLLFNGVQLIVIGILGAYLGGIYEEVKRRPRYIVEEKITYHG
jgi:polyisoprenyl-phosphate glycosyltransferase